MGWLGRGGHWGCRCSRKRMVGEWGGGRKGRRKGCRGEKSGGGGGEGGPHVLLWQKKGREKGTVRNFLTAGEAENKGFLPIP